MSGYKGGRIVKIKVKDFMTYDNLEIFPKKGLNIIIGLNGSGKSSLMSAICLGLTGKPQFTGKSNQLADFIKHGKQKAMIEIELDDPVENVVICRTIEGDKTTWRLNNLQVQQKEVVTTIKKYNIDVGNLCQFLPQEKVSDFSKIDQKQRLEILIEAIGEPILNIQFKNLKKMRVEYGTLEKDLQNLENSKFSEVQLNERLKVEVDKHEERIKLLEDLETFKLQKKCIEYEAYRRETENLKKEKMKLKTVMTKAKNELNNMESESSTLSSSKNEKLNAIKEANVKCVRTSEQLSKLQNKLSELHKEAHSTKIEFQNKIAEKRNQKEKLADIKKQILALQNAYAARATEKERIQEKTVQNSREFEEVRKKIGGLDSELENIKLKVNHHEYQNRRLLAELSRLRNEDNIQLDSLKQKSRHTYDAVCWLEQNKSSFKSTICLPPFLSVKVQRDEHRKHIENMVGMRDLKTFICRDADDAQRLINIACEQKKLNINVGIEPPSSFDCRTQEVTPNLRNLGVEGFASDLFTAPEPVVRYLCNLCHLHKIPICNSRAANYMQELSERFFKFYTPDEKISRIRSRYGGRNFSVRKDCIVDKGLLQSATNGNHSNLIREHEAHIKEAQQQIEILNSQAKTYETQRSVLERELERLRNEKSELLENIKNTLNLEVQLKQKKELYERKKSEVIDETLEKKKMTTKICDINKERMAVMSNMERLGSGFVSLKMQNAKDIIYVNILSKKLNVLHRAIEEKTNSYQVTEQNLNAKTQEYEDSKRKAKDLYNHFQTHATMISQLQPHLPTLEEIEQKIIQFQAQLDLNYEDNESILQEYQSRQKLIIDIAKKIEILENKVKHLKEDIERKKQQWLPVLQSHIRTINMKFSQYYKLLKCAGEISLETGDDPYDFEEYGLQVKLKYRDEEPFSVLSPDHHSGGERNVASVIFILSLQELTTVPFRCVDEINQGMDSSNEKKMYEFIASDAAKTDSCSQYFLLTPKLLKDLSYHEDVAVHVIFNSRYLGTKLNIKEHLKIAKKS